MKYMIKLKTTIHKIKQIQELIRMEMRQLKTLKITVELYKENKYRLISLV